MKSDKIRCRFFILIPLLDWHTPSVTPNIVCRHCHTRHTRRRLHLLHAVRPPAVGHHFYGGHSRRLQKSIPGTPRTLIYWIRCILFISATTSHPFPPLSTQSCPLDLHTDQFYANRQEAIEARVQMLSDAPVETLHDMMEDVWSSQEGKVCSLVSWERFTSLQQAKVLTLIALNCRAVSLRWQWIKFFIIIKLSQWNIKCMTTNLASVRSNWKYSLWS